MTLTGDIHAFDELRDHALGWRGLLDGLRFKLEQLNADVHVSQVKEKFGGLRVYVDVSDDRALNSAKYIDILINAAEYVSFMLCYLCGAGVTHRGSGYWVRYFCAEHDTADLRDALLAQQNSESDV